MAKHELDASSRTGCCRHWALEMPCTFVIGHWSFLPPLLVAGLFALLTGCGSRANPEPIHVGHVAPLSGADKDIGEQGRKGIQLAVKEANEGEKVLNRKVAVDHGDTRSDKASVRGVTTRLLT